MTTKSYICSMTSTTETSFEFLRQSITQTRKSIKGIDDSYNNEWDILAELCQNSVDAIKKVPNIEGNINIVIDSRNKSIKITDNGIGIKNSKLPVLLAPFSTDKENDAETIGEKGVGLTFAIFSCNEFYIKTGFDGTTTEGRINNALDWKNSFDNEDLKLLVKELDDPFIGTSIELKKVKDTSIFNLTFEQIKFILRTKTAIGNTLKIWGESFDINVTLTTIDNNGKQQTEKIDYSYFLITEKLSKNAIRDINDWYEYIKTDRSDKEKRKYLFGRIIYKKDTIVRNGRSIKYWACFTPFRKTYKQQTIRHKIATDVEMDNSNWLDQFYFATFQPGITASVKGMPTGINIEHPVTGAQGAWPQIFIIFEDSHIKFDIGRKSIHGMQAKLYREISKNIFSEFQSLTKHFGADANDDPRPDWNKQKIFDEINGLLDLNFPNIKLLKTPKDQEASLVGLFYECIGNGIIKDILPMSSGYKRKYDLYAKVNGANVVIEFKSRLKYILDDFESEKKMFDEIDCAVCWNLDEEDKQAFKNCGITVNEIEHNELLDTQAKTLPNATHELSMAYVSPIYIIDMKKLIEDYNSTH